jgi:hypothetical protein
MRATSWLCRDEMDRERLLDMEHRLKPVRGAAMGVIALALIASAPWVGWWTLVPLLIAAGLWALADSRVASARRPEYLMFAAWASGEVMIAGAVALAGGPRRSHSCFCWRSPSV